MSKRKLNMAAPDLLSAAKYAVRELRNPAFTATERMKVVEKLTLAIDAAEPDESKFRFTVTPTTFQHIKTAVTNGPKDDISSRLSRTLESGARITARRVYVTLVEDLQLLERLADSLQGYDPHGATSRALDRLVAKIKKEYLDRSPLELIAKTGL